jgi:oligopeptide transport system substrate-binding protein
MKKLLGVILSVFIVFSLSACGNSGSSSKNTGEIVYAYGGEPATSLIPFNTTEVFGGRIIDLLYSGLTYINENNTAENDLAKDISSNDNKTWNIELKSNLKFSDGSPITSDTFIYSWNFAAKASNGQLNNDFYSVFAGYDELNANKKVDTLSGLNKVSDTKFTVELNNPASDFKEMVGYSGFFPVPKNALNDDSALKEQGEHPVSSGPYKPDGENAWKHNESFTMIPNPNYDGFRKAKNGGIQFKAYSKDTAAYADLLSGQLDVMDVIPSAQLKSFQSDLGDRALNEPIAGNRALSTPVYLPHFKFDEEGVLRRQAFSQAIDREQIIKTAMNNTVSAATDFIPPMILGHSDDVKGNENIQYNPDDAKKKWEEANAISKWDQDDLKLIYDADNSSNQLWTEAVANSVSNVLGIKVEPTPVPTFSALRKDATGHTLKGFGRSGWQCDYPSSYNMLAPQNATDAGSNDSVYSNKDFDNSLDEILQAKTDDEKVAATTKSQEYLMNDLPLIPLWNRNFVGGYSENVSNVKVDWHGVIVYNAVEK